MIRRIIFAWFIVLGVTAASAYGQSSGLSNNRSSISGYIFGPDRRPLSQVWVELRADVGAGSSRVRTDGSGRYYFPGLPNGRYQLRVLPFGTNLEEKTEDVELAGVGVRGQPIPQNEQRDIYLRERKGASAPLTNKVIFAQDVPKDAEAQFKSAENDIGDGHSDIATPKLERAIEIFPKYFAALLRLGTIRLTEKNYPEAESLFRRAWEVNQRCFDCQYGISYVQFNTGKFADAQKTIEKALEENRESIEGYLLLGMSARSTKDLPKAEQALVKASKLAENTNPDVLWQLALLYGRDQARYADAAKQLELYLKAKPDAEDKEAVKKLIKSFKDKASAAS